MDKAATPQQAPSPSDAPPPVVVPARVEPLLADLAEARGIAMRFLRRMDQVAEAMPPEELKQALAEDGQLVLNVTRMDRALRQIGVLEEEVMGRRVPAVARGIVAGGPGKGSDGRGRHDFNDLNDLNDLNDPDDLDGLREEVFGLFDPDSLHDQESYADFAALEKFDTFKEYSRGRKRDGNLRAKLYEQLDSQMIDELEKLAEARKQPGYSPETWAAEAELAGRPREPQQSPEEKWRARRDAILRLRAAEKRLLHSGRGPPGP